MKKFLTICAAILMFVFTSNAQAEDNSIKATYFVVNCNEYIHLWDYPSTHAGNHLATIPLGQAVGFIEVTNDNFSKVNYDGLVGYVISNYISPTSPFRDATVVNCRQSITLREEPTTYAREMIQIPLGTKVKYLGVETNSFYKVQYRGMVGFVLKTYLEID
ncbi:MAG: SH3 domain-containing protein [Selenomonadaceae bacterium]|nr:SH3 domain-containing protein [Selenomonadaceae bacterium]